MEKRIINQFDVFCSNNGKTMIDINNILPKDSTFSEVNIGVKILYVGQIKKDDEWVTIRRIIVSEIE